MHDPFQSYQTLGAFSGAGTPFGLPYGGQMTSAFGNPGIGAYGIHPQHLQQLQQMQQIQQLQHLQQLQQLQNLQQLQLLQQLQGQGQIPGLHNPFSQFGGMQNPWQQHAGAGLYNPILAQQNPWMNPQSQNPLQGYQAWQQQQPYGNPLAPQSLIGGGTPYGGNPLAGLTGFGGIHPLAQLLRGATPGGISPFGN